MAKQHDKQFKLDAVQYYLDHKELGVRGCAQNLGVCYCITSFYSPSFLYRHKKTTPPVLEGPHSTWIYP